jgi:hypothetical protein
MRYKIGYIDEDFKQVERYERKLRNHFDIVGYNIESELPLPELIRQVYKSDIDLLLVDYLLVDKGVLTYNGDEVVRAYEEIKPRFPILIFTNEEGQAFPQVDNPNIIIDKSIIQDNLDRFIKIVEKNIVVYKNYIAKRKTIINSLIEKGEKDGISANEKNSLLEAQLELKNLDKWSNEVPYQLLDEKKLENLSKTRKDAEEYLESLIKKNKK